jgi:hypothetical protein
MSQKPESKTKRLIESAGDAAVQEAIDAGLDAAIRALGEALSCAAELAANCGETALNVTCEVAGHALDGI